MALLPSGPEIGVKYTLTGPDGTKAVFNEPADPNYVGVLEEITGFDSAEVRENAENISGDDGGIHGNFYYGRRPVTLSGKVFNNTTSAERNEALTRLQEAANAMRADATLEWTPSGGEAQVLKLRRSQPLRVTGDGWAKNFQLLMTSAEPNIQSVAEFTKAATAINEPPSIAIGTKCKRMELSPDGAFLYVTDEAGKVFVVNVETPEPKVVSSISAAANTIPIAITTDGKYVFTAGNKAINRYSRNAVTGELASLGATTTIEGEAKGMVWLPGLEFLVVIATKLYVFAATAGALSQISTTTTASAYTNICILSRVNNAVLVTHADNTIAIGYAHYLEGFHWTAGASVSGLANSIGRTITLGESRGEKGHAFSVGNEYITLLSYNETSELKEIERYKMKETVGTGAAESVQVVPASAGSGVIAGEFGTTKLAQTFFTEEKLKASVPSTINVFRASLDSAVLAGGRGRGVEFFTLDEKKLTKYIVTRAGILFPEVLGEALCTNSGSAEVYPSSVKLELPAEASLTKAAIVNITTGEQIAFLGTLGEGTVLNINFKNRTVTDAFGANVFSLVDTASTTWWKLVPGVNKISLSASEIKVGEGPRYVISWKNGWV